LKLHQRAQQEQHVRQEQHVWQVQLDMQLQQGLHRLANPLAPLRVLVVPVVLE
jgi:hypothetical protein